MTIDPITFVDTSSGDDACVLVRVVGDSVGLVLSSRTDGDIEVFMAAEELDRVIGALQQARVAMRREGNGMTGPS
ncbi:hypothetical protein HL666_03285 [Bradyrhizobium sp. 83002]|uniref:hypothetical protein n=1 Tax=Bradyrhizobium aeschynomenes TaxID=2734909 RepID=UPI0015535443|nr:hypothetical protein [Bradyrhizobium aeschynomenes]NPU09782.1 hypothetical protein [Bradyrhizobium aeschynomenes]